VREFFMGDTVRWMESSWSFSHKGRFLLLSRYLKLSAYALRAKPTYKSRRRSA